MTSPEAPGTPGTVSRHEVVVIGAGGVGLALALRLLQDGREVLVGDHVRHGGCL
jgi:glycine/D-amino acid oxidase-like deaminating enzyme